MNSKAVCMRKSAPPGFTLVELLVVVGLMAVILTITITNFMMSSGGAKIQAATMNLKSSLSLARQYAISRNETIYLVFSEPGIFSDPLTAPPYRAYNVWSTKEGGFLGSWILLPEGTFFNMATNSVSGINVYATNAYCRFSIPGISTNSVGVASFSFLSNGRLNQNGDSGLEVFISEGTISSGAPVQIIQPADSATKSIFVYPLTGQANVYE